jgi:hypothetical protein
VLKPFPTVSFRSAHTYLEEKPKAKGSAFFGVPEVFSQELFRDPQASRFHTSLSLIVSIA